MQSKDFEIGKMYRSKSGNKETFLCRDPEKCFRITFGIGDTATRKSIIKDDYEEITVDDLSEPELMKYKRFYKFFDNTVIAVDSKKEETCTCEILSLMAHGCLCGGFKKEMDRKHSAK